MKVQSLSGAVVCALVVACAPAAPPPAPSIPQPNPPLVRPPFRMDTTLLPDRVPPFQQAPLIVWGPPPEGTTHPERARTYDLQHQTTTVRFDWPRQAVVGTTTLTIAGLRGAAPVSNVVIDAGDMTFKRVASGQRELKYDYDGHALTVHDIRREAAEAHLAAGAQWADSPAAVAAQSEVVVTSLPGPKDVEIVALAGC